MQTSVGASVVYDCTLDIAKFSNNDPSIPDHDKVAFPNQKFNQKISFHLNVRVPMATQSS